MKSTPIPYSSPADAMKEGVGRNSRGSSPAPVWSSAPSASASALHQEKKSAFQRSATLDAFRALERRCQNKVASGDEEASGHERTEVASGDEEASGDQEVSGHD